MINLNNINYIYDFYCTYKMFVKEDETNLAYQIQLMQAFNMKSFDSNNINKSIDNLFNNLKDCQIIEQLIEMLKKKHSLGFLTITQNVAKNFEELCYFQLLFSYDYFDSFHRCLCNYFNYIKNNNNNSNNSNKIFEDIITLINNS